MKMNKTVSKEEAINLIKKSGGRVINDNFVIVGETAKTYKVFRVAGKVINRECLYVGNGYLDFETITYQADLENPVLNGFVEGSTEKLIDGTIVKIFKSGKYTKCEFPDGSIHGCISGTYNGCEVRYIKKEDAMDCDTWNVKHDWGR